MKVKLSKSGVQNEVKLLRDILSTFISLNIHHKAPLDIKAAMAYPLAPVSLALCNANGSIRKTKKSSLYKAAMAELVMLNLEDLPPKEELPTYFLDLTAAIRSQLKDCETIKQLAWRILSSIPKQYDTVFIVCDTYLSNSIKGGEKRLRGEGKRYVLNSTSMWLSCDMLNFLRNGQNKEMLFSLLEDAIIEEKQNLNQVTVYFSNKNWCNKITSTSASRISSFASDHKEADTKLVALVNAFNSSGNTVFVLVRPRSGDIDILMLFLLHQFKNNWVLIDNGTSNSRKITDMSSTNLTQLQRQVLTGIHAIKMIMFCVSSEKGRKSFGMCRQSIKDFFRHLQTWAFLVMWWRKRNKR